MPVLIGLLIIIGLLPIKVTLLLAVSREREAELAVTVGPMTIHPGFGQGKTGLPWLKKLTDNVRPPVPLKRFIGIVQDDVHLSDVSVAVLLGLDDAAVTAMALGVVKSALSIVCGMLKDVFQRVGGERTNVSVRVVPDWSRIAFQTRFEATLRSRVGRLVHLVARLVWLSLLAQIKSARRAKRGIKLAAAIQNKA